MSLLRAILVPVLLVIFASPLPLCAVALAATGENCHERSAPDAVVGQSDSASDRHTTAPLTDDQPDDDRRHDATCTCDADRPTSKSDPIIVPAFVDLPLPLLLLPPPDVTVRPALSATALPPPALAAVSLPLLN